MVLDLVSSKASYPHLHHKLIKSYAMEALLNAQEETQEDLSNYHKSLKFMKDIKDSRWKKHKSVGYGWDYRFENRQAVGSALIYQKEAVHTGFFKKEENYPQRMSGYRVRRNLHQL